MSFFGFVQDSFFKFYTDIIITTIIMFICSRTKQYTMASEAIQ